MDNIMYIKFGITNKTAQERLDQIVSTSKMDYYLIDDFFSGNGWLIKDVEKEIKKSFECKVCPKELLPDGWTETVAIRELDKLLSFLKQKLT